jgi:sugar phosphate isomerase/epimerase
MERAMRDIADAGFREIDLLAIAGWCHLEPHDMVRNFDAVVQRVDHALSQTGLTVRFMNVGVSVPLWDRSTCANQTRVAETEALAKFMTHFGVKVAALQAGPVDPSRTFDTLMMDCVQSLYDQYDIAEEHGVVFGLEPHYRSPIQNLYHCRKLCDCMPRLQFVFDPSHLVMSGIPIQDYGWLLGHSVHVHLRDATINSFQVPFLSGEVDVHWVLNALADRDYGGSISVEYLENERFDALAEAKRAADMISAMPTLMH